MIQTYSVNLIHRTAHALAPRTPHTIFIFQNSHHEWRPPSEVRGNISQSVHNSSGDIRPLLQRRCIFSATGNLGATCDGMKGFFLAALSRDSIITSCLRGVNLTWKQFLPSVNQGYHWWRESVADTNLAALRLLTMSHNGSSETSSFIDECWASWFCNLSGNHFFCEIDKAYMEDSFNLFGLKQHVPKDYSKALDTILDRLGRPIVHFGTYIWAMFKCGNKLRGPHHTWCRYYWQTQAFPAIMANIRCTMMKTAPTEAETEELSRSAALLYGLIHARYIITSHGLESMVRLRWFLMQTSVISFNSIFCFYSFVILRCTLFSSIALFDVKRLNARG